MVDMPPQQEVVSPAPEQNRTEQDNNTLNYSDFVAPEVDVVPETHQEEKTTSNSNEQGRVEIPLAKSLHTVSGFKHITGVSYGRGKASYDTKQSDRTTTSTKTAQETIEAYEASMDSLSRLDYASLGIDKIVALHNYYTRGVVARNSDGTEAVSSLGTKEQVDAVLKKAKDKALDLLSGKRRLGWKENSDQNIDAFLRILPEKERNDFIASKDAIVKNAQTYEEYKHGDKPEKKPSKIKTWFKNLFSKKEKIQPVAAPEKPWYETFNFDDNKPMESIQAWCKKTAQGRLSQQQYEIAKSRIPEEYRKVAAHIGTWYRETKKDKKEDFTWDKLPETRQREFVSANEEYKKNKAAKVAKTNENSKKSSKSIGAAYKDIKANREHRMALRRSGLGSGGIGRF